METYDISQTLSREIAVWPGDPEFQSRWSSRIQNGEASNVSAIDLCVHTGTHVDAPLHLDDAGKDIAGVPLDLFIGSARVLAISAEKCIRAADLSALDWSHVERVLFKTRPDSKPDNSRGQDFIWLNEDAAEFLVQIGLRLVGTDAPSIDAVDSILLPSHRMLLRHGIAILEGAKLEGVPPGDYELVCLPLKLAGLDGSPVRAILRK